MEKMGLNPYKVRDPDQNQKFSNINHGMNLLKKKIVLNQL